MSLQIFDQVEQGTVEWLELRRGIPTASVIGRLLTSTLKVADNETSRTLTAELVAERITGYSEDVYVNADMERGNFDEPLARDHYSLHIEPVTEVGFMVRDDFGYRLGYSPDGLVGDDGLIEVKSRRAKKHIQTILANEVPAENMAQIQCGLLVSGRAWCDYVSWCGGLPMYVKRVTPSTTWHQAITEAAERFEDTATQMIAAFNTATRGLPTTERVLPYEEMVI